MSEFTEGELEMLRFALDVAQEIVWARDGFTEKNQVDLLNIRLMLLGSDDDA
jgi:hypothetical protein